MTLDALNEAEFKLIALPKIFFQLLQIQKLIELDDTLHSNTEN